MKKQVSIFDYTSGIKYLGDYFDEMKTVNPRVSLRSLATKLGVDQSTLSRYFAGERHISSEKAAEIGPKLKLDEVETHYLKLLFLFGDRGETELLEKLKLSFLYDKSVRNFAQNNQHFLENLRFVMDLKVYLIYELQKLRQNKTVEDLVRILSKYFETDKDQVYHVLNALIARGFLDEATTEEKRQNIVKNFFVPSRQIPRSLGVKFHKEALHVGLTAFDNFETTDVEILTCLVPIKKENREKLHKAIRHLSALIKDYAVDEGADDVFLVSSFMVNVTNEIERPPSPVPEPK